jgi:hypothetical protein
MKNKSDKEEGCDFAVYKTYKTRPTIEIPDLVL